MRIVTPFLVLALVASAAANIPPPFKETLSRDERMKIAKAIQDRLKVDKTLLPKCQPLLDEYNKDEENETEKLPEIATCYHDAGSLSAAIIMWQRYEKYERQPDKLRDTIRAVGRTYEEMAFFDRAADYYVRYAKQPGPPAERAEFLTRAICIYRQIGTVDEVTRDTEYLQRMFKVKTDSEKLCDGIHPIAMPAP